MNINWELTIAVISTLFAGISIVFSMYSFFSFRKLNKKIIEQQIEINTLLLNKETENINEKNKAEFRAYTTKSSKSNHLIITNVGKAIAENTHLEILIEPSYSNYFYNIDEIFPINLSPHHSSKVMYSSSLDFPSKFTIKLTWDDQYKKNNQQNIEVVH